MYLRQERSSFLSSTRIAARDFDGDGLLDLLLTHAPTIADVNLRRGKPTDPFLAPHRLVGSVRPHTHVMPLSSWRYAQLIASDRGSAAAYAIGKNGLLHEMATLTTAFTDLWPVHLPATGGPYADALLVGKSPEGKHTVLKWDGQRACELAPLGEAVTVRAGGDVNGDGIMDLVGTRSCRACTSNHVLFLGRP